MRKHRLHLLALALMVAFSVLAAGCGGDDDDEGAATAAQPPAAPIPEPHKRTFPARSR